MKILFPLFFGKTCSRLNCLFLILLFKPFFSVAQPFTFISKNTAKPIVFTLSWTGDGKAAFVRYKGKSAVIPLKLKHSDLDTTERSAGQPDTQYYKWNELYGGQVTGEYGLSMLGKNLYDVYYIRYNDGRRFEFTMMEDSAPFDGKQQALLHQVMFNFNVSENNMLEIKYGNGTVVRKALTALPDNGIRYTMIADYNFDGYDDISFSSPDFGQGVYRIFDIFLFDPATKKYKLLELPANGKRVCGELCDVKINIKTKTLSSSCRGGAGWHRDDYRFDKTGKLVWLKSAEVRD